jgi:hypothetical protein
MATPAILRIDIVGNARDAQRAIASTDSELGKLGKTGSKLGPLLKAGAAAGVLALGALGKAAYDSASELQQSMGAVDSVFGKSAEQVKAWAGAAADSVGLAKSEYGNLAALLGSQLTNMGRSQKEAAGETDNLIRLGSDLAATYGGSVADAVSAVSSVLKGETDPIERYGVSVKKADINARLAAEGQDKLTGTALKQAEATAALSLIMEQSTSAAGAFGRESNTAAGQQQRFAANLENTKAKLGEALLPIMTAAFGFLNETAFPAVSRLGAELSERFGPTIARVGAFVRDDLVPALRRLYEWFNDKILPNIKKFIIPIVQQIRSHFVELKGTLDDNSGNLEKLAKFMGKVIEVAAKLLPIIGNTLSAAIDIFSESLQINIRIISTLVGWIDSAVNAVKDLVGWFGKIPGGGVLGKIGGLFASPVAGAMAPLAGRAAGADRIGSLVTAAAGGGAGPGGYLRAAAGVGGAAFVDARRTVNVTIRDAYDPVAVATAVRRVLREDDVRNGRAYSYAPATGWAG